MPSPISRSPIPLDRSSLGEPSSPETEQAEKPSSASTPRPQDPPRTLKHPEGNIGNKTSLAAAFAKMGLSGESSRSGKKYSSGVFRGATRPEDAGFDEEKMHAIFSRCPEAVALEKQADKMGFRYTGDTGSQSKANTMFMAKTIKINAGLSPEQAALSFAYELANACQHDGGKLGPLQLLQKTAKTGEEYAESVLRWESKSVLKRSQVAVAIGHEDLVVNPKYNQIAKNVQLSESEKVDAIFSEMKTNGKVNRGQDSAFDHYVKQYQNAQK